MDTTTHNINLLRSQVIPSTNLNQVPPPLTFVPFNFDSFGYPKDKLISRHDASYIRFLIDFDIFLSESLQRGWLTPVSFPVIDNPGLCIRLNTLLVNVSKCNHKTTLDFFHGCGHCFPDGLPHISVYKLFGNCKLQVACFSFRVANHLIIELIRYVHLMKQLSADKAQYISYPNRFGFSKNYIDVNSIPPSSVLFDPQDFIQKGFKKETDCTTYEVKTED
jgi:hypothetical protein